MLSVRGWAAPFSYRRKLRRSADTYPIDRGSARPASFEGLYRIAQPGVPRSDYSTGFLRGLPLRRPSDGQK